MTISTTLPTIAGTQSINLGSRERGQCCHCGERPGSRPRRLCWVCYSSPGVRDMYPSLINRGIGASRGSGIDCGAGIEPPASSTDALPGSPDKVAVLEDRARRRQSLWHPADVRMDDETELPATFVKALRRNQRIENAKNRKQQVGNERPIVPATVAAAVTAAVAVPTVAADAVAASVVVAAAAVAVPVDAPVLALAPIPVAVEASPEPATAQVPAPAAAPAVPSPAGPAVERTSGLAESCFNLVRWLARKFWRFGGQRLDLDDLIQEGFYALFNAEKHFNPDLGKPFIHYAHTAVKNALRAFERKCQGNGMGVGKWRPGEEAGKVPSVCNHGDGRLCLKDRRFRSPVEMATLAEEGAWLNKQLDGLSSGERELVRLCFWEDQRCADIARAKSMTRQNVQQRLGRLLIRLRNARICDGSGSN